jgi:TonB family protein
MGPAASRALGAFEPSLLDVRWQERAANLFENLRVVVRGPRNGWGLHTPESFFRLRVAPARRLGWQLAGSLVCHAFLLVGALAVSRMAPPTAPLELPEVQITWYGLAKDVVPKIAPLPKRPQPKAQARSEQRQQQVVTQGYNPNTTVVFRPPRATNLRQMLIQPQAPPQVPKLLLATPNIIQWEADTPDRPAIEIQPNQLRPVQRKESEQANLRAPRITYQTTEGPMEMLPSPNAPVAPSSLPPRAIHGVQAALPGEAAAAAPALGGVAPAGNGNLAFAEGTGAAPAPPLPGALGAIHATQAASPQAAAQGSPAVGAPSLGASTLYLPASSGAVPLPPLPSGSNAVRARSSKGSGSSMAAPSVGPAGRPLVSLSLSPGTAPPPPGNAYAPMSIGPHPGGKVLPAARQSVDSGGSGEAPGFPAPEGSATGPEDLLILRNANPPAPPPVPRPPASAQPKPARVAHGSVTAAIPRRPIPVPGPANREIGHGLSAPLPGPISVAHNVLLVGVIVQDLANRTIGPWSMPTLAMNLPRLSNSRGTWVLDFADPMPSALRKQNKVIVPLPLRAVEPQYPASLRQKGVRGKVVLSAMIESDGKVSQIRVMQSLNPVLDQKAKAAFSRWKFDPGLLNDKPIAMPVIVTVPFQYAPAPH